MNILLKMIVNRMKINDALIAKIDKVIENIQPIWADCSGWDEIRLLEKQIETIQREQDFLKELITGEEVR